MASVGGDVLLVLGPIVGVLFFIALVYCFFVEEATTDDMGYQIRWNAKTQRYEYMYR